jgi:hypothetical protein
MTKDIVKNYYTKWLALPGNQDYVDKVGYSQAAAASFLTYVFHEEGLIESENKNDMVALLGTEGVGFLNFSQHEQFLRKEGLSTKRKSVISSLTC